VSSDIAAFERVGNPVLGRTIMVPTANLERWLKAFGADSEVHAGSVGAIWISQKGETKVDETCIFVSMGVDYDQLPNAHRCTPDPLDVMRRIDRAIRHAQQTVRVYAECE
jgi:hypothetical protein